MSTTAAPPDTPARPGGPGSRMPGVLGLSALTLAIAGVVGGSLVIPESKPEIPAAARVRTGPALMALTRTPDGPRSAARYRTEASRAALATPITL